MTQRYNYNCPDQCSDFCWGAAAFCRGLFSGRLRMNALIMRSTCLCRFTRGCKRLGLESWINLMLPFLGGLNSCPRVLILGRSLALIRWNRLNRTFQGRVYTFWEYCLSKVLRAWVSKHMDEFYLSALSKGNPFFLILKFAGHSISARFRLILQLPYT